MMSGNDDRKVRFSGRITASATHEFQNILAIINENAGLLKDLMALDPANAAKNIEATVSAVEKQVARGVKLVSRLNSFAHTGDKSISKIDAVSLCRNLIGLTERLSSAAGTRIVLKEREPVFLMADAVELQVCLYYAMEALFLAMEDSTIFVDLHGDRTLSSAEFSAGTKSPLPPYISGAVSKGESFNIFKSSAERLGARTEISGSRISVFFS